MLRVYTNWRFELNIDNMTSANVIDTTKFITVVSDATWNNNTLSVDWVQVAIWNKISTISKITTLFHRWSNDWFKWKIHYVKVEDWNTEILELIPCYRKSDNVIWFRDIVNKVFYTNRGSGSFTKWGNI
jgi:hypothetical protein